MSAVLKTKRIHGACYHNNNNLPDMAPLAHDDATDTLIVEGAQHDAWAATDALATLEAEFKGGVRRSAGPVERVAAREFRDAPEWLLRTYRLINRRSNAARWWAELVHPDGVIPITDAQSEALARNDGSPDCVRDRAWLSKEFQRRFDAHPCPDGWFVKCGTCSTKHQYPPEPVFSGPEAVVHLLGATPVTDALATRRAQCFVLRPWTRQISANNEFRVFVRAGRVTGVSQQACYSNVINIVAMFPPDAVIAAAQACYDAAMARLPPARRLVHECTFDAYLESSPDGEPVIHLIEINAENFGWGPAGASLFDWRDDPPPAVGEPPVVYIVG